MPAAFLLSRSVPSSLVTVHLVAIFPSCRPVPFAQHFSVASRGARVVRPSGSSPHASVMVVSFGGACPLFFGGIRAKKDGHHSHFLKDSFCYHRRNRPDGLRPRPCFLTFPAWSDSQPIGKLQEIKAGSSPRDGLLAQGGASCPSPSLRPITPILSPAFVAVSSAAAFAAGFAIVRQAPAWASSGWLSRPSVGLLLRRTGARRKCATASERPASVPKSARGSAGAFSPGMAIIPQRPAGRSFVASTPLIFLSSMGVSDDRRSIRYHRPQNTPLRVL